MCMVCVCKKTASTTNVLATAYRNVVGLLRSSDAKGLSEVGFEPTPGEPDCDLNAAP